MELDCRLISPIDKTLWIIFSFSDVVHLHTLVNMYASAARVLAKKYNVSLAREFFTNDTSRVLHLNEYKITHEHIT